MIIKNDNEKKGLFARLNENKKTKKSSCCCNVEIEEIPEEENDYKSEKNLPKIKVSPAADN